MHNYFKVESRCFFFNDAKVVDTQDAFALALSYAEGDVAKIAVYQIPPNAGPWDRVGLIGYRRRHQILADLAATDDPMETVLREEELKQLDRIYYTAGRDRIPMELVAA